MKAPDAIIRDLEARNLLHLALSYAKSCHVELAAMFDGRSADVANARHALWTAMNEQYGLNRTTISIIFGMHYTTVSHGITKHRKRAAVAESLGDYTHQRIDGLEARLDDLERLSVRLEKACTSISQSLETLHTVTRRAS